MKKNIESPVIERGAAMPSESAASETEAETLDQKTYMGKQQDLYAYARLGWSNYLAYQPVFGAFSPYYTVALGDEQLAFIQLTEALPDDDARKVEPLDAKEDLMELNINVLKKFADGRIFIERTYKDKTKQETMLKAAGEGYYTGALSRNWTSSMSLITSFKGFLTSYGQELVDSKQMPPNFAKDFDTVSEPFVTRWQEYKNKWDTAHSERKEKFRNNQLIYKELSEMFEVGKIKFAANETVKKKFTLTALLKEVSGNHPSGVKGKFTIGGDNKKPVLKGRIWVQGDPERFATPDKTGRYELRLPSGKYVLLAEAEGFESQVIEKIIKIGIMSRLVIALKPVVAASAAPEIDVPIVEAVAEKLVKKDSFVAVPASGNGLVEV